MSKLRNLIKPLARPFYSYYVQQQTASRYRELSKEAVPDLGLIINRTHAFVDSLKCDDSRFEYRYSAFTPRPTLYSSVYACMIFSLTGRLNDFSVEHKTEWAEYINSFQNSEDGLYYDPVVNTPVFSSADWWGKRHLALHITSALVSLGSQCRHPLHFLETYYSKDNIDEMLSDFDWHGTISDNADIDNKIMNVGCLLQYQRDTFTDNQAGEALNYLREKLLERLNPDTGIWGRISKGNANELSRAVQFAYHLFPLFFYDNIYNFDAEKVVALVQKTQNELGGYGVRLNSSACEDIDSIEILVRLYPRVSEQTQKKIRDSLDKSFKWVTMNQVDDGGFVFRLFETMQYGHPQMQSMRNQGAMFPTWFRLLSIAYLLRYKPTTLNIVPSPGLSY